MSMLAALTRAYGRLAEKDAVPPLGYSMEKIGFCIVLQTDGKPAGQPIDLREGEGRKRVAPLRPVPQPVKRTSGIAPNFLWDKTSYVLGITGGAGKRLAVEHEAFKDRHFEALKDTDDPGLIALRKFLVGWTPDMFEALAWPDTMKDANLVFRWAEERRFLHERPAAQSLWQVVQGKKQGVAKTICLVSGEQAPIARLHPAIKGVWGAQSSGASIVSFNLDAFTSYNYEQGENAPVSETAAFAYTTALNHFLARGSPNRIQIGDASTVFWADANDAEAMEVSEGIFAGILEGAPLDVQQQAGKVGDVLSKIAAGRPIGELTPDLPKGVRFHVLGLAPNAARLSVRFWFEDDFAQIGENSLRHFEDMRIFPPPSRNLPGIWRCLVETASRHKSENIPPQLAGDMLRAVLTGGRYPQTLLATLLMRLRADKDVNGLRAALLKAVITRSRRLSSHSMKEEIPVSLDPEYREPGYLLGRLFAAYEYAQTSALGSKVKATIRDQFYGTASATPRAVFPILQRKSVHHLSRLRKDKPGLATNLDRKIGEIFEASSPDGLFVPTLSMERQALFAIGYYHQRNAFYAGKTANAGETHEEIEE